MNDKLAAFAEVTSRDDLYDPEYLGGDWMIDAVETRETFEDFITASADWAECSNRYIGTVAGLPVIVWPLVQCAKGQPRQELSVVDFGDRRVAMEFDLREYLK